MSFCIECGRQAPFCECRHGSTFVIVLLLAIAVVLLLAAYWPRERPEEHGKVVLPAGLQQIPPPRPRKALA